MVVSHQHINASRASAIDTGDAGGSLVDRHQDLRIEFAQFINQAR